MERRGERVQRAPASTAAAAASEPASPGASTGAPPASTTAADPEGAVPAGGARRVLALGALAARRGAGPAVCVAVELGVLALAVGVAAEEPGVLALAGG